MEYLMFVDVRERAQVPEGVRFRRVPSLVRLMMTDETPVVRKQPGVSPCGRNDALGSGVSRVPLVQVFRTTGVERERDSSCLPVVFRIVRWTGGDSELPSDVIETGRKLCAISPSRTLHRGGVGDAWTWWT